MVVDGWVVIDGERVLAVGAGPPPERPSWSLPGLVVPGFVDVHVHGGGGASFDGGSRSDVETVVRTHLEHGTTTMVASLVTDSMDGLAASCSALAALADEGLVAGIHLEGPWLSPARAGAHESSLFVPPTLEAVDRLVEAARGHLRMVTLAPELPGALVAIPELVAAGVVVAVGHTDATYDETRAALEAGATAGTHLFNAMPPLHHREPGPVAALLESSAYLELVADGVHVHPSVLALAWRGGRTALVTDAMAAAGAADGEYTPRLALRRGPQRGGPAPSRARSPRRPRRWPRRCGTPRPWPAYRCPTPSRRSPRRRPRWSVWRGGRPRARVVRRPGRAVRRPRGEPRHAPRSLGPPILSG